MKPLIPALIPQYAPVLTLPRTAGVPVAADPAPSPPPSGAGSATIPDSVLVATVLYGDNPAARDGAASMLCDRYGFDVVSWLFDSQVSA